MSMRGRQGQEPKPWRLLLWTALAGLIFGLIQAGEVPEDALRVFRNGFHEHNASGQIVVIKVDDQSLHGQGNWPWPRHKQAQLVDKLTAADAKQIVYDINFSFASNAEDDRTFSKAIERSGRVTLLTRWKNGTFAGTQVDSWPLPIFADHAGLGVASVFYNWENASWRLH